MLAPYFNHGQCGFEPLIEDPNCTVAVAAYEDVASDLIGSKGSDAGA